MNDVILVTGAAGFIGYHLCARLLADGRRVVGLDNLNSYYPVALKMDRLANLTGQAGFSFVRADLADAEAVLDVFKAHRPKIVVNLAAQAGVRYSIDHPHAYLDSNVTGFLNVLEACRHFPVDHLLFASSSSVYGNSSVAPFSVDERCEKPVSLYAATKRAGELMGYTYSHLYGIPMTGLRFFTVYGPFGRPDMAYYSFTRKMLSGEPIEVFNNGDLQRDFTYVDDIVEGLVRVLPSPPSPDLGGARHRLYNIGNNRPEKLMRFIEVLEQCLGVTADVIYRPMQPGDVYQTSADIAPLARDFGFAPSTRIEDGLKRFTDWYRAYHKV